MKKLNRLTPLEIAIDHGACAHSGCAICNRKNVKEIAQQLQRAGFHVESFSDDSNLGFGYIDVRERGSDCSRLLKQAVPELAN